LTPTNLKAYVSSQYLDEDIGDFSDVSNSCAFWHFSGNAITDLNNVVNAGDLWNGGSGTCNTGILDYYWSENESGLSTRCEPS
jgi:hypothetical protein